MSNLSTVTDNMLPVASETFVDNLAAGISAGADTVPLLSLAEYSDGDSVVLTVDPGTADQATFIGVVDGNEVIDVEWTEGNVGASHAAGATVIDYDSATHYNVVTKLLRMFANQNGTLKTAAVQAALNISSAAPEDYTALATAMTVEEVYANRSHKVQFAGVDYTDRLTKGMRIIAPRTVPVTGKSTDFNGTTEYALKASPTGLAFTDDFTCEAWVYIENYASANFILSRRTTSTNGYSFYIDTDGSVALVAGSGAARDEMKSVPSIPLNQWVHVAAQLDLSGSTGKIYIDGSETDIVYTNSAATATVQAGDLYVSRAPDSSAFFVDGQVAEVRLWSTMRTSVEILENMNHQLAGTETGLVGYWKLDADFTDSTANDNDLTPQGGVTADYNSSPFNANAYMIISTDPVFTGGNTELLVQCPVGYPLPSTGATSASFSAYKAPKGFPLDPYVWDVVTWYTGGSRTVGATGANAWYNLSGFFVNVPAGAWDIGYKVMFGQSNTTASIQAFRVSLSTANSNSNNTTGVDTIELATGAIARTNSSSLSTALQAAEKPIKLTANQRYTFVFAIESGAGTITGSAAQTYGYHQLRAKFGLL